jgi:hypothetical protein
MRVLLLAALGAAACGPSLSQVKQYAEARELQPDAPVKAESSVEIDAPVELVWRIFAAVDAWPHWNDDAPNAKLTGWFDAGSPIVYGGAAKHELRLAVVEMPKFVSFYGTFAGYTGVTLWTFEAISPLKSKVTVKESNDGFMISLFYGSHALEQHLQLWTSRLKTAAEHPPETH